MKSGIAIALLVMVAFAVAVDVAAAEERRKNGNSGGGGGGGGGGNSRNDNDGRNNDGRNNNDNNSNNNDNKHNDHDDDHHDDKHHYSPPHHYPQTYHHPQTYYPPEKYYYCTYFCYEYGHYPHKWDDHMKDAAIEYNQRFGGMYGCSFGDEYNYGHKNHPGNRCGHSSQGGYICFEYEHAPAQWWSWFYKHPKYSSMGYATPESGYCHYKDEHIYDKSNNLPHMYYAYKH